MPLPRPSPRVLILTWAALSATVYGAGWAIQSKTLILFGGGLLFLPAAVAVIVAMTPLYDSLEDQVYRVLPSRWLAQVMAMAALLFALYLLIFVLGGDT